MRNWLTFNGKSSKDFGVYISGLNTFDAPERDVETVAVAGRNGELTLDNGRYKNIDVTYPAFIFDDMSANIAGLRNFLLSQRGFKRLEDTYHPDEYRLARYKGDFSAKVVDWLEAGKFDLVFDCYPQRFLKSGEHVISLSSADTIFNEYMQTSKPLIRAYGTGSFTIEDVTITINTANGYTDIDCDLQEAYKDTLDNSCNSYITLNDGVFPELVSGENDISMSGLTQLDIIPRWWIL